MNMEQVGQGGAAAVTQRWNDYFSRRFRKCLDRLRDLRICDGNENKKPTAPGWPGCLNREAGTSQVAIASNLRRGSLIRN